MHINIVGAGMAGLLAANILRRHKIIIYEIQDKLPNNHHATLRFRTPNVGDVLGIQFQKVNMIKTHVPHLNIVADSLSYARKTTGIFSSDRSIIDGTVTAERYIAPSNLIKQMAKNVTIEYNYEYDFSKKKGKPTISTIPMPILMKKLGYTNEEFFRSYPGIVLTATIGSCNAYISILFPGDGPASRATITGDKLMIEFPGEIKPEEYEVNKIYAQIGLYGAKIYDVEFKTQKYFKITSINEAERHNFMKWATVHYNIYSLGRYACWRPKLLLDDLIKDVRIIEGWIAGGKNGN